MYIQLLKGETGAEGRKEEEESARLKEGEDNRGKSKGQVSTRSPLFYIGFDLSGKRPGEEQKRVVSTETARFCGEAAGSQSSAM